MINRFYKLPIYLLLLSALQACSFLTPGMYMDEKTSWLDNEPSVYIESIDATIKIQNINNGITNKNYSYKIGIGDEIQITIWGIKEVFPMTNNTSSQNLRRVDQEGNIFFPYVGLISAKDKTQDQLRNELTQKLSSFFKEPQLDLAVVRFNSKKVYVLGEVTKPVSINISDVPVSLSEALGRAYGLNTKTAKGEEVYVIRNSDHYKDAEIFKANLSSPSGFISSSNFYLQGNDIIYVNASGTARWNRIISQFFPFSSFVNTIDNLLED